MINELLASPVNMGPEMSTSVGEKGRLSSDCILCKLPLRLPGVEDLKKKIEYVYVKAWVYELCAKIVPWYLDVHIMQ